MCVEGEHIVQNCVHVCVDGLVFCLCASVCVGLRVLHGAWLCVCAGVLVRVGYDLCVTPQ